MQILFKNVGIDLVSTFHAKSFFLQDIILLTDRFDSLFTVNDKPYVNKDSSLSSFLNGLYKGDWDALFLDLFNFAPNTDGRNLVLFFTEDDYVLFVGKFVSSLFPELSVDHKARLIQAVCDDTRYVKSAAFASKAKAYLSFNPTKDAVFESAKQIPCKLPQGFSDHVRFDWVIGHHWCQPERFFPKILKNVKSLSYQEFRAMVFKDLPDSRGIFAFNPDRTMLDAMGDQLIAPSFDDSFGVTSFYSDPDGEDVKRFLSKYGVGWLKELSKAMVVGSDYLQKFPVESMVDENEMVSISESPEKMQVWFSRLVLNAEFRQHINFPLLAEWVRFRREGVPVKTV